MSNATFYDKNGKRILPGDVLKHQITPKSDAFWAVVSHIANGRVYTWAWSKRGVEAAKGNVGLVRTTERADEHPAPYYVVSSYVEVVQEAPKLTQEQLDYWKREAQIEL